MNQECHIQKSLTDEIEKTFTPLGLQSEQLVNFSCPIDSLHLIDWLTRQAHQEKLYWSSRNGPEEVAGVGVADVFSAQRTSSPDQAIEAIEDILANTSSDVRYYGGICFDCDDTPNQDSEATEQYRFFVPRFEIRQEQEQTLFIFNVMARPQDDEQTIIAQFLKSWGDLSFDVSTASKIKSQPLVPSLINRYDIPDQSTWELQVAEMIDHIRSGCLEKVVPARVTCLKLAKAPDSLSLFECVSAQSTDTYDFYFQSHENCSFMGCSPECLYEKEGDLIFSEALAGTHAISEDQGLDMQFQEDLLESQKEAQEHEYVYRNIQSELESICDEVDVVKKREVLRLGYAQHLRSSFKGLLRKGINNWDILKALHPTAAVNGYPKSSAQSLIRRYERFSRGWYAGPIGWIGRDCSDFCVAIRSAHVSDKLIKLFAGAGIVSDSDPVREWNETEMKLAPFLALFETSLNSQSCN
jgi:menaquinone-specific isochorismate synthase